MRLLVDGGRRRAGVSVISLTSTRPLARRRRPSMHIERIRLVRVVQTAAMFVVTRSTHVIHYTRTIAYAHAHTQAHTQDTCTNVFKRDVVCFATKRLSVKFIVINLSQKWKTHELDKPQANVCIQRSPYCHQKADLTISLKIKTFHFVGKYTNNEHI